MNPASAIENINTRGFLFTMIGVGLLVLAHVRHRWRTHRSRNWPTAEGTIQFTNFEPLPTSSGAKITLSYSYFVDEYRSGEWVRVFVNGDDAYDVQRYVKTSTIEVRYNPRNPDKSQIDEASLADAVERGAARTQCTAWAT